MSGSHRKASGSAGGYLLKSTPEQLVGALADKTPDMQVSANVFHLAILKAELSGKLDLSLILLRPLIPAGREVQLGDKQGVIIDPGPGAVAHGEMNFGWRTLKHRVDTVRLFASSTS